MDILQVARGAWRLFQKRIVWTEIGIASKPLFFFILRRRVSVGPGCDVLGKRGEFRTQRYIHVAPRLTDQIVCSKAAFRCRHHRTILFNRRIEPRFARANFKV